MNGLSEYTFDEILEELINRCDSIVFALEAYGDKKNFREGWKGGYLKKAGLIHALNTKQKYFDEELKKSIDSM